MRGKKLLINTMLKAKLIERGIPKLSPIVTANSFQEVGMFICQPQSQAPKVLKHFILAFQVENPRVMRIVVNPWGKPERNRQCPYGVTVRVTQSSQC
jgi:hypothetical protein